MLYRLIEEENKKYTKDELISLVKKATQKQLEYMRYDFDMIGFYREDKRKSIRQYIINCLENCYVDEPIGTYAENENRKMKDAVLSALKK